MLRIRAEQITAFRQHSLSDFVAKMMVHLRSKYSDRVPTNDELLSRSIVNWIRDANQWGLTKQRHLTRYLESRASTQGRYRDLEERLVLYLRIHHSDLVRGIDLPLYVRQLREYAIQHDVHAEEGITWLAVILLTGSVSSFPISEWVGEILDEPGVGEELRMVNLHRQAASRHWFANE